MKLEYPPFEATAFHPSRQLGLEETTAFVLHEPGCQADQRRRGRL